MSVPSILTNVAVVVHCPHTAPTLYRPTNTLTLSTSIRSLRSLPTKSLSTISWQSLSTLYSSNFNNNKTSFWLNLGADSGVDFVVDYVVEVSVASVCVRGGACVS